MRSIQRDNAPNSVLGRAFALLSAFRPQDTEVSLATLCRRTGISKSTAHRLLRELSTVDAVEQLESGGYRLGMSMFELGQLAPRQRGLREAAAPFLADLLQATQQTVHLAVLDGTEVVYLQKIDGRGPEVASRIGGRMPAYCTGVGKAMLAFAPAEALAEVLAAGLPRRTSRTVVVPGLLTAELAAVRDRGYAEEHEESTVGVACVAAPVLGPDGAALAAVSITGWANRLDTTRFAPAVRTAALGISRTLGLSRHPPR